MRGWFAETRNLGEGRRGGFKKGNERRRTQGHLSKVGTVWSEEDSMGAVGESFNLDAKYI